MKRKIKNIILSWDTFAAMIVMMITYALVPADISNKFCTTIYGTAIGVLSIIFSIFFASLAVILAFPDNKFIKFIEEEDGYFTKLLGFFRFTLYSLFVALLYTIIIYVVSNYDESNFAWTKPLFIIFAGAFAYSLMSTGIAVDVTIKITSQRAQFLVNSAQDEETQEQENNDKEETQPN